MAPSVTEFGKIFNPNNPPTSKMKRFTEQTRLQYKILPERQHFFNKKEVSFFLTKLKEHIGLDFLLNFFYSYRCPPPNLLIVFLVKSYRERVFRQESLGGAEDLNAAYWFNTIDITNKVKISFKSALLHLEYKY